MAVGWLIPWLQKADQQDR